jgi:hypothetical protein
VRYVVGPQRQRSPSAGDDDDLAPASGAVGGRSREKVGIWLPRTVRQRLRIHAAVLDREISEVIEQAITEYLDRHDQQRAKEGLPPIPMR